MSETSKRQNWPLKASTPAAAQMLFMALAVATDVDAAAAWVPLLGLEPTEADVDALTAPILTGFVEFPGAANVTMLPPGIWLVPPADNPAVAIVLMIFPLLVLVSTMSLVGVDEADFVALELLELPAAIAVEIFLATTLAVVLTTELVLDVGTATVFTVSTLIFAFTLFTCPISLTNFAGSLESCLHSPLSWVRSLHTICFSTDLGSCFTKTWDGKCVEDMLHMLTKLLEFPPDFVLKGPFMWVWSFDGEAYNIVSGLVMVFPPLVVVIVVVTTLLIQALWTPLLAGSDEIWLLKSDLLLKPLTVGSFTAVELAEIAEVEEYVFKLENSPLTDELSVWLTTGVEVLLTGGWERCLAIPHCKLITLFNHWNRKNLQISHLSKNETGQF